MYHAKTYAKRKSKPANLNRFSDILNNKKPPPAISNDTLENGILFRWIKQLEAIAMDRNLDAYYREAASQKEYLPKIRKLREFYSASVAALETWRCTNAIKDNTQFQDKWIKRTVSLAEEEGRHSEIAKDSKVLVIGSGPLPETAFALAQRFGCNVVCVDHNQTAVALSSFLAKKLRMTNKIRIVFGDGTKFNCSGYTHIVVTSMSIPKKQILGNVIKSAGKEAKVICRDADGIGGIIHEPIDKAFLKECRLIAKITLKDSLLTSLILRKDTSKANKFESKHAI